MIRCLPTITRNMRLPPFARSALFLLAVSCPFLACLSARAQGVALDVGQISQAGSPQRDVSWEKLPHNFLLDQKEIWLFPVQLAHGHHWLPTLCVLGATTGLLLADAHDTPYFRTTSSFQGFNRGFSGSITDAEIALVPASFYLEGLIRKDSYSEKTALFAGEAVADSLALNLILKVASRRLRPSDIAPTGNFSDTFFRSNASVVNGSFPSAHAMAAFSVATILSRALSRPPLGSLGRVRRGRRHLFLSHHVAVAFSFRRFPRRGLGVSHRAFRGASKSIARLLFAFCTFEPSPLDFAVAPSESSADWLQSFALTW